MSSLDRRQFLESVVAAGAAAFAGIRTLQAADALVDVNPSQPGPVIGSHLYGHFIEHLGGVIYDGIWVGRDSKIPNVGGIRQQFVDDMRRLGAPNLRWPGGCFADGYHWRDPAITTPVACCGSARRLPGGNWVIGWGSDNASTEVTPAGTRRARAHQRVLVPSSPRASRNAECRSVARRHGRDESELRELETGCGSAGGVDQSVHRDDSLERYRRVGRRVVYPRGRRLAPRQSLERHVVAGVGGAAGGVGESVHVGVGVEW